jgi:hypothetical protein
MLDNLQASKTDSSSLSGIRLAPASGEDNLSQQNVPDKKNEDPGFPYLPDLSIDTNESLIGGDSGLTEMNLSLAFAIMPEDKKALCVKAERDLIQAAASESLVSDLTHRALMKDADLYPPVQNADGSTTYSINQVGITDRNSAAGANFYSRKVDITVPAGTPTLDQCSFKFGDRQIITEAEYDELLKKDTAGDREVDLYTHGVSCTDSSADRQALMLELSNGRPTVNIDWTANPPEDMNPFKALIQYLRDTAAAKRANNNKTFVSAIDRTIEHIGAEHTGMIGFSHGAMFDTRYLKYRAQNHLPKLDTVILTHPDVPISASELFIGRKPEVLRDSASHSYVIGSQNDLSLKMGEIVGYLPGGTTFQNGKTEERLGSYSWQSRAMIAAEGADAIKERDEPKIGTHHFLNLAGIAQLLDGDNLSLAQLQTSYDRATDLSRQNPPTV